MEVHAHGGERFPFTEGTLRLEEGRQYFIAPGPEAPAVDSAFLDSIPLDWVAQERAFRVPLWHSVGARSLLLVQGQRTWTANIQFIPHADKLAESAWDALLSDLEAWLPAVSVGAQPGLQGAVVVGGSRIPLLVEAALPLLPALLEALRAIIAHPRKRTDFTEDHLPAHQVRRVERTTLGWLARHPEATRSLSTSWDEAAAPKRPPFVPVNLATARLDHPANRYVAWLVQALARELASYAALLNATATPRMAPARTDAEDWKRWCAGRAERLLEASDSLLALFKRSWLAKVAPSPPTEAAMAVVIDDPSYARLHRLGRHLRSPLFQHGATPGETAATTRPSYELYELWTFFATRRLLEECLPGYQWTSEGLEPLAALGEPLDGASFTATGPEGTVQLLFNPTFPGYLSTGTRTRFSISKERRPDLLLRWSLQGHHGWVCLDAKYRVSRQGIADAFESAHLYRDSLRWPAAGGRCEAAVLLAPAELSVCAPWFSAAFLQEHQVGAFQLAPGHASTALSAWLRTRLRR